MQKPSHAYGNDLPQQAAGYNYQEDLDASNIKQLPTLSLQEQRRAETRRPSSLSDISEDLAAKKLGDYLHAAIRCLGWLAAWYLRSVIQIQMLKASLLDLYLALRPLALFPSTCHLRLPLLSHVPCKRAVISRVHQRRNV